MTAIEAIKERRIAATIARFGCDRETAVEFLSEIVVAWGIGVLVMVWRMSR